MYIEELHNPQNKEGLHLGNKLRKKHLLYKKMIIKVNLAAQTLSESVAAAIDFCRTDLKLKEFEGSEATSLFIRNFNKLFDQMNSKSKYVKNDKSPLTAEINKDGRKISRCWKHIFQA